MMSPVQRWIWSANLRIEILPAGRKIAGALPVGD